MTDAQGRRILALAAELRQIAGPAGPMHAYWDVIADLDCFVKGRPTIVQKTADEWIEYATRLTREATPRFGD